MLKKKSSVKVEAAHPNISQLGTAAITGAIRRVAAAEDVILTPLKEASLVTFRSEGGIHRLLVAERSRAWPSELHGLAVRLTDANIKDGILAEGIVIIAPTVSKNAAEVLEQHGLNWVDHSGNCRIKVRDSFVLIMGKEPVGGRAREPRSPYTPKASQVVHVLLTHGGSWTLQELAEEAGVSIAHVASVKGLLAQNDWVSTDRGALKVTRADKILEDWARHGRPRKHPHEFFVLGSASDIEERIRIAMPEAAFAEFSAAHRYAPYVRHRHASVYVTHWSKELGDRIGVLPADRDANLFVYEDAQAVALSNEYNGVQCASPIHTYLDLISIGGRGVDAAEQILERHLRLKWLSWNSD